MFDHRTGTLHDYTRKNGVIAWHHLAPAGAQGWQLDPEEFWNRAEAAERRSDSQVARCYRVPVPLGFDEESAVAMALEIAERLRDIIEAPVSLGVHQDSDVDGLGNAKALDQIGYHAHIYLPTRGVTSEEMAGKKEGIFLDLGNRAHSGEIIERFNKLWADIANRHAQRQLLAPRSDHRSLLRQGVDREPVPTLGIHASALERRGVRTEAGEALRLLSSAAPAGMDHAKALKDVASEAPAPTVTDRPIALSVQMQDSIFMAEMSGRDDSDAAQWRFLDRQVAALRTWIADREGDEAARLTAEREAWRACESRKGKMLEWQRTHPQPPLWRFWERPAWRRENEKHGRALWHVRRRHRDAMARTSPKAINEWRAILRARSDELTQVLARRRRLAEMPSEKREAHGARRAQRRCVTKEEQRPRPMARPVSTIRGGPPRRMR